MLLSNISSFICTQLNDLKYRYVTLTTQLTHTVKEFQVLLINTNNSIQYHAVVSTQLNGSKNCYVSITIQLNLSYLFTHSLIVKQFYF